MLAGFFLAYYTSILFKVKWALAAYPGVLSLRGVVNGVFCGRLSTGLHLGTIKAGFRKNTREFYALEAAVFTLNMLCAISMSAVFTLFGVSLWGVRREDLFPMWVGLISSMALSFILINPATLAFAALSYKKGYDPDYLAYPVMSTAGDVIVTLCYIFVVTFINLGGLYLMALLSISSLFFTGLLIVKYMKRSEYLSILKETIMTLTIVVSIVGFTGTALTEISRIIGQYPSVYMIYPAVLDTVGDVGSIIGSTLTTKLALGEASTDTKVFLEHLPEVIGSWLASIIMFLTYTLFASVCFGYQLVDFISLSALVLKANIIAVSTISLLAVSVAVAAYRYGLDPDNFVNPIVSAIADALTSFSILVSLAVI